MRRAATLALIALTLLLAGCAQEADSVMDDDQEASSIGDKNVTIPDPIRHSGSMRLVMVPVLDEAFCQSTCEISYPFEVRDDLSVEVVLVSRQAMVSDPTGITGIETDYDLELVDASGKVIGESYEFGGTPDRIVADLRPGKYSAKVYTYQDADGSYELTISFSA